MFNYGRGGRYGGGGYGGGYGFSPYSQMPSFTPHSMGMFQFPDQYGYGGGLTGFGGMGGFGGLGVSGLTGGWQPTQMAQNWGQFNPQQVYIPEISSNPYTFGSYFEAPKPQPQKQRKEMRRVNQGGRVGSLGGPAKGTSLGRKVGHKKVR